MEVTSFVRPDVIPQLADAPDVLAQADIPADVSVSVLVPNRRGLEMALELADDLRCVGVISTSFGCPSSSDSHAASKKRRTATGSAIPVVSPKPTSAAPAPARRRAMPSTRSGGTRPS